MVPPLPKHVLCTRGDVLQRAGNAARLAGDNVRHPLRNPAGASYLVGGSASGSAVAVAQRLVDFSLGSDVIGNVRLPAACCGLFALRPTLDKVRSCGAQVGHCKECTR